MPAVIEIVSVEKHEGDAVTLVFHQNQLFSGGADGKICIWDENLKLLKTISAHDSYIYALAISDSGNLYSSSCDGLLKVTCPPYESQSKCSRELKTSENAVQSMYWNDGVLYTGDDIGVVCTWKNNRLLFMYNLVEEVKSIAAENSWFYTVRDLDVVVTEMIPSKAGKFANRMVLPGRAPLILLGSKIDTKHQYLAYADRTGKGLVLTENAINKNVGFKERWQLTDCHEMIITAICGNKTTLFSGGYDNKVKAWSDLDKNQPTPLGEVDCGNCINFLCCSKKEGDDHTVYIACSDGYLRKARFS